MCTCNLNNIYEHEHAERRAETLHTRVSRVFLQQLVKIARELLDRGHREHQDHVARAAIVVHLRDAQQATTIVLLEVHEVPASQRNVT